MDALKANSKFRCCCGKIHVTTGTQIICGFFLLLICVFIATDPKNILSAAIIAGIVIVTLFGTFFENHFLILPLYWILTLALSGLIFESFATVPQYFIHDKEFIVLDFVIRILSLASLLWFTFILKKCYEYFKWLKVHTNFMQLKAVADYFQNVMPKKQQLNIENEGDDDDDNDSDESSGKSSDKTESESSASVTSVECQTDNVEN